MDNIGIKTIEGESAEVLISFFEEDLRTLDQSDDNIKIKIEKKVPRVQISSSKGPTYAENKFKEVIQWCENRVEDDVFKLKKSNTMEIKKICDHLENNAIFFKQSCVGNAHLFRIKAKTPRIMQKYMEELHQLIGRPYETPYKGNREGLKITVLEGAVHSLSEEKEKGQISVKESSQNEKQLNSEKRQELDNTENKAEAVPKRITTHTSKLDVVLKNGLRFMVYVKDITAASVDAIVNPANEDLDNFGGCAREISIAAGKRFEDDCKSIISKKGKIRVTENEISKPGKLPFRCIINAVGPQWGKYDDPHKTKCLDDLDITITNILITSEKEKLRFIAIPPISSGIFGVPKELCALMYLRAILNFKKRKQLEQIHLVNTSDEILDLVCSGYDAFKENPNNLDSNVVLKEYEEKLLKEGQKEKKRNKSSNKDQDEDLNLCKYLGTVDKRELFRMSRGLTILIYKGDLVKLKGIGTLVSAENSAFTGSGALAQSILQHAGLSYKKQHEKVKKELSVGQRLRKSSLRVLHAGNLEYRFVIHAIVSRFNDQTEPHQDELDILRTTTSKILDHANTLYRSEKKSANLAKIAMPLLGAGAISKPGILEQMCRYVLYGIDDFLNHNTSIITEIHLVSFNENTNKAFLKVFLDYSANEFQNSRPCPPTKRPLSASMTQKDEIRQACAPAAIWKMEEQHRSDGDLNKNVTVSLSSTADDNCIICLKAFDKPVEFKKCRHTFCQDCIGEFFSIKPVCPVCNTVYGKVYGDQPKTGTATIYREKTPLPGEKCSDTWVIFYDFPDGCQEKCHPNPRHPYKGTRRVAYLPASKEGTIVLHMLEKAFKQGLTFTIGVSRTTGRNNVVTWNDIHHKTNTSGGPERFGYPDPDYLQRVREELEAKGITAEEEGDEKQK